MTDADDYPTEFAGYPVGDFLPEPDDSRDPRQNPANDAPRPISELAADASARLETAYGRAAQLDAVTEPLDDLRVLLDALVARVTDLEAQVEDRDAWVRLASAHEQALLAAEAQVAALTQERDDAKYAEKSWWRRALAAEAALADADRVGTSAWSEKVLREREEALTALATTRQALAEIEALQNGWLNEAKVIARRALAATEDT